jgi:hypothetical protein
LERGEARLDVVTPNKVGYEAEGLIGYWIKENWGTIEVPAGPEPFVVEIDAIPAGAIYGTVLEADGSRASKTMIHVSVVERPPALEQGGLGVNVKNWAGGNQSDKISRFVASPLPLGGKYVIVAHRGWTYLTSEVIEVSEVNPAPEVALQYGETIALTGRVVDPQGRPLPAIRCSVGFNLDPGSHSFGTSPDSTDAEGRIRIEGINPHARGDYSLTFKDNPGYQPKWIDLNLEDREFTVTLEPGLVLEGVAVDQESGWPLEGAEVYAQPVMEGWSMHVDADSRTNDKGEFRFSTLAAGTYRLDVVQTNGFGKEIEVKEDMEPVRLEVRLPDWYAEGKADYKLVEP